MNPTCDVTDDVKQTRTRCRDAIVSSRQSQERKSQSLPIICKTQNGLQSYDCNEVKGAIKYQSEKKVADKLSYRKLKASGIIDLPRTITVTLSLSEQDEKSELSQILNGESNLNYL